VIIPVYNRAAIVHEAIRSVLTQSFQDFELVIVDDGSTDDLLAAVGAFLQPMVRLLRQDHRGANWGRNAGIDAAAGLYVAFLDSDDRFLPGYLESLAAEFCEYGDAVLFAPVIADRGSRRALVKPPRAPKDGEPISEYLCCDDGFVPLSTASLATARARQIRFSAGLPINQDIDFAIRLAAAGCHFRMLPIPGAVVGHLFDQTASQRKSARNGGLNG
jgi:glycosyltransferase involved in cell wall biosynthesis